MNCPRRPPRRPCLFLPWLALIVIAAPSAHAQAGWGLAPTPRGDFYFCDINRDEVWHLAPAQEGRKLTRIAQQTHCHNIVPGYDGFVYGEDIGGESRGGAELSLWRISPDGVRSDFLPQTLSPDPSVWIVRDAAGNLYAWNGSPDSQFPSQILKRSPDGVVTLRVPQGDPELAERVTVRESNRDGPRVEAQLGAVGGMAAARDGTLYVVQDGALREVRPDGSITPLARGIVSNATGGLPGRTGLWNHSMGVAVDDRNNVYIVDYSRDRIVRRSVAGGVSDLWKSGGLANALTRGGWGWVPVGVAVVGDDVYVLENWPLPRFAADLIGSPRLLRLDHDGRGVVLARVASPSLRVLTGLAVAALAGLPVFAFSRRRRRAARKFPFLP